MVCYVCLEECDQQSPCKCQTEIHKSCLIQMQLEMPHKNCTICHLPLKINFKTVEETNINLTETQVLDYNHSLNYLNV
jgi:E3 ubiquitin-protein ligase DOA10